MYLLHFYLSKLPQIASERDVFYWQPKESTPMSPGAPWFEECVVGKGTLEHMVQTMCNEAGISRSKTNYSLKATGVTRMYEGNVPEKIIQEHTGHRHVEACVHISRPQWCSKKSSFCPVSDQFLDFCTPKSLVDLMCTGSAPKSLHQSDIHWIYATALTCFSFTKH